MRSIALKPWHRGRVKKFGDVGEPAGCGDVIGERPHERAVASGSRGYVVDFARVDASGAELAEPTVTLLPDQESSPPSPSRPFPSVRFRTRPRSSIARRRRRADRAPSREPTAPPGAGLGLPTLPEARPGRAARRAAGSAGTAGSRVCAGEFRPAGTRALQPARRRVPGGSGRLLGGLGSRPNEGDAARMVTDIQRP